jgi:hypothetical protein
MSSEAGLSRCRPHSGEWHDSRSRQTALYSCQVGQWSGEVTAVTSALSTGARVRRRCQAIFALNAPMIWSVGVAIWPRLLLREAYPS